MNSENLTNHSREVDEITKNKTAHYSKFVLDNTYFIWKDLT